MADEKPYPENLPPEVTFRQFPAAQRYYSQNVTHSELDLPRYTGGEDFHLRELWRLVRKRKWLIIGIALIATTLVTLDVFRTRPIYEATATIEIGRDTATRIGSSEVFVQESDYLSVTMNTSEV